MSRFDPNSTDAVLATILAKLEANTAALEKQQEDREDFKAKVLERFDDGTRRMDKQDTELAVIKQTGVRVEEQVLKTNGRVSKLEAFKQSVLVRVATITAAIGAVGGFISWAVSIGLHKLLLPLIGH